eukprot:15426722-Alexandrium_andersonii.AAC.1
MSATFAPTTPECEGSCIISPAPALTRETVLLVISAVGRLKRQTCCALSWANAPCEKNGHTRAPDSGF